MENSITRLLEKLEQRNGFLRLARMSDSKDIQVLYALNGFKASAIPSQGTLENRIFEYPDGQFVVEDKESSKVIGYASLQPIESQSALYNLDLSADNLWMVNNEQSANFLLRRIFLVHPKANERRCTKLLDDASKKLTRENECKHLYIISRIPGYKSLSDIIDFKEYVAGIKNHRIQNHNVSLWLYRDYEVIRGLEKYRQGDAPSDGCAVLLRWTPSFSLFSPIFSKKVPVLENALAA